MDWKFEISRHKLLHTRSIPGDPDGKESTINARTWVRSLGQEDPLEKGMAIYSSILAWRIPWTEEPGRLHCLGLQEVRHN